MLPFVFVEKAVCGCVCGHPWISHDFIVTGEESNSFSDVCNLFLSHRGKKDKIRVFFDKIIVRALSCIVFAGSAEHRFASESFKADEEKKEVKR